MRKMRNPWAYRMGELGLVVESPADAAGELLSGGEIMDASAVAAWRVATYFIGAHLPAPKPLAAQHQCPKWWPFPQRPNCAATVRLRNKNTEVPEILNGLGDSSTVEQRTLTPLILVRIQVPQPRSRSPDVSRCSGRLPTGVAGYRGRLAGADRPRTISPTFRSRPGA